jgi:hypothetical protein
VTPCETEPRAKTSRNPDLVQRRTFVPLLSASGVLSVVDVASSQVTAVLNSGKPLGGQVWITCSPDASAVVAVTVDYAHRSEALDMWSGETGAGLLRWSPPRGEVLPPEVPGWAGPTCSEGCCQVR